MKRRTPKHPVPDRIVFLFDVDNTLLDNDQVIADLGRSLRRKADKLRILAAFKKIWRSRVTTVFVRQGHYARDAKIVASCAPADVSISRIGSLLKYDLTNFTPGTAHGVSDRLTS